MPEMEEHTGVFGASGDQLQIPWEVNAQGCCQSLGIAGFLHCPKRVYHVADTASHVTRRSNCTLVSENIVRVLLYLRPRVPTLCSQTSSGGDFPVYGNILYGPRELGLIGGLMEEDPTGYDGVLGCYLRFCVAVSRIDIKGSKLPPTPFGIYAICPLKVTRSSFLSSQSHFIFYSSHLPYIQFISRALVHPVNMRVSQLAVLIAASAASVSAVPTDYGKYPSMSSCIQPKRHL
jgi:hypothetical protein